MDADRPAAALETHDTPIATMSGDRIAAWLRENEPDTRDLCAILRNPSAGSETLATIGRNRSWTSSHEVRALLVDHPQTPTVISRNLVQHLFWKQLADVCRSRRAHVLVRRDAERYLSQRVRSMALGERVAVARIATRGVVPALLRSGGAEVLVALLDNPLLREDEAVRLAGSAHTPPQVLSRLTLHGRWIGRGPIRSAALQNPALPVADALRVVARADPADLRRLANNVNVPRVVRVAAERRQRAAGSRNDRGLS